MNENHGKFIEESKRMDVHGTAVTSIIGSRKNEDFKDFVGIAPNAEIKTFGVPQRDCGPSSLRSALKEIKKFSPHIVNISSTVLSLKDHQVTSLLEDIVKTSPHVVFVVAAGNDGGILTPDDTPCSETFNEQFGIESLANHKLKDHFILVGNLALKKDLNFNDLYLLPDDSEIRSSIVKGEKINKKYNLGKFSLKEETNANFAVNAIKLYLLVEDKPIDYFPRFHVNAISDALTKIEGEIEKIKLLTALDTKNYPSKERIRFEIAREEESQALKEGRKTIDVKEINDLVERKFAEIASKESRYIDQKTLEIKKSYCLSAVKKEVEEKLYKENSDSKYLNNLFIHGLPKDNWGLLKLATTLIPLSFRYSEEIVLAPDSARAGALSDIFISTFGTNVDGLTFSFDPDDIEKQNPIFKVEKSSGTSYAAPIVSASLALVMNACDVDAQEARKKIFLNANADYNYSIFGQGMLDLAPIIEECRK